MNKKYFETKPGSLEEVSTKIAKEQPSITKPEPNVKLTTEKNYFGNKPGSLSDIAAKIVSEAVDPVNKDAVKKDFADRKDKDIDNDGDTDSSDEYLHKRRQAISKSMKENKAYMLSYGKKGEKAKFFYGNTLSDIQKKAHELRKQGIVVDKMGRTEPTHKLRQTIESVNPDDKGEKQNADKVKAYTDPKKGEKSIIKPLQELENKKTFKEIRIKCGEGSKTDTGKTPAVVDTEPSTKPL